MIIERRPVNFAGLCFLVMVALSALAVGYWLYRAVTGVLGWAFS